MLNGKSAWEMDSKENVFDKQEAYDDIKETDGRRNRVENSAISDRMYFENEFAESFTPQMSDNSPNIKIEKKDDVLLLSPKMNYMQRAFVSNEKLDDPIKHPSKKEITQPKVLTCSFCLHHFDTKADLK